MLDMRRLKCNCCRRYDCYDGCIAFDCDVDFEISIAKVKETAEAYGMSADTITLMLMEEEKKKEKARKEAEAEAEEDDILPDDFNPFYDSQFLISFADSPGIGKKLLVEMDVEDLKRLRAEIYAVLKIQEG